MRNFLGAILAAGFVAAASADISTSLVEVANGLGAGTKTYDLKVNVTGGDDWTSTSMKGSISGGTFYNDAVGSNSTPNPAFFAVFPTLQWDTFATQPEAWPNTAGQGAAIGFAGTAKFESTLIDATWFDTPANGGDGSYVLARVSVQGLQSGWQLKLDGAHTTVKGGSTLTPYSFVVPEPSTLGLLVLGGLAGLIRRR